MTLALAVGITLLAGAAGGKLARIINLPSVTGFLLAGIIIGPSVLNLIPTDIMAQLGPINELALGVIALSIGAELRRSNLRNLAKDASKIFAVEASLTFALVLSALLLLGTNFQLALVFAVLSIATAPGAIISCIRETPIKGNFPKALLTVVALDNLTAIALFGLVISYLQASFAVEETTNLMITLVAFRNLGISILIGGSAGLFLAGVAKWSKNESRTLILALGAVLVSVGLATLMDAPALLAAMSAGAIFVNISPSPQRVTRSLQSVEGPILLAFLTLAGAKLDIAAVPAVGLIGLVYILARFLAKLIGSRIGASFTDFPLCWKQNIGRALTPQAGVAIGLAIIAEQKLPFPSGTITTVVLGAVVVFELIGPVLVKRALCDIGQSELEKSGS